MANTTLNMQLLLRRDDTFNSAYVLAEGEPGFEVSSNTLKIGDGTSTWANLKIANKEEIDKLIEVVNDKVTAIENAYATDKELEDGLALKADLATYNAYVEARKLTDTEINTAIGNVDAKFANYTTTTDQQVTDAEQDRRLGVIENDYVKAADIANFETKQNVADAVSELNGKIELKADKSVVEAMYTNAQIDGFIADAKKHADDNDANTEYHVEYDSDNKKIKLVAGADAGKMEIDATDFIKDGMIESVALSEDGLSLVITWNTDSDKGENNVTEIPLIGLVDIYTGVAGARVTVSVSQDNKISADLVAGSISKNYLDAGVQASLAKADSAIQDVSNLATKTELGVVDAKFANYTTTTELNGKLDLKADKTQVATDITNAVKAETDRATGVENGLDGRIKDLEDNKAGYATKAYVDGLDHEDTTYVVAPTANALEFTVTPNGKGEAQTVQLVAPTVDVGVTKVTAGNTDIVVTPEAGTGEVTVAHAAYQTGTIKAAEGTEEPNFLTSVTISNGHVTGASVQTLRAALESMTFILDGGTSTTNV